MHLDGYKVTREHQGSHWWYRSRRELYLRQVRRAADALGHPVRRLALLDYGCAGGFDLAFLDAFGAAEGADVADAFPANVDAGVGAGAGAHPIHLVPRDVDGLRTIGSLLAPGGQVVVTVPAYAWLWSGEDEISAHRRRYTRGALVGACRAAGFEVLYASYFNASLLPAMAAVVWGAASSTGAGAPRATSPRGRAPWPGSRAP